MATLRKSALSTGLSAPVTTMPAAKPEASRVSELGSLRCEPVPGTKKALLVLVHGGLGGAARVSYAEEGSHISVDFSGSVHKNTQEPCSIM